ncbi:MAG: UDP-N-acetylmuramoyl-tripeptide--D-alanyl-D-alanine ligase [Bacillota bacterium]|nr:UDP-N-acetylmuramoyl-tripeptide--D-alanyl-D-alanine ligase [Bacillota bacterium]
MLFTVGEACRIVDARLIPAPAGGGEEAEIRTVTHDSRRVGPGALFVAIPGATTDGHLFVDEAFSRGAAAALVAREPPGPPGGPCLLVPDTVAALGKLALSHRLRFSPVVIGITGSLGKTSTKDMAASVLGRRFRVLKNEGNLNTEVGVPLTLFGLDATHQVALIEMAMRGRGQIAYLAHLARPGMGVITNVSESHLELLGSVEEVARAKGELLEALPADGTAILNGDDARVRAMGERFPGRVVYFGLGEGCQVRAEGVQSLGERGTRFLLHLGEERGEVTLPIPGRHQVPNALAAAAVAWVMGLPLAEVVAGLQDPALSGMRMEVLHLGGFTLLNDAYNASPTSTSAALETLAGIAGRRRLAVLGDMLELGPRTVPGHQEVGRLAARLGLDHLVTVGPLSRHLAAAAREEGMPGERVTCVDSAREAIPVLTGLLQEGDVVLVKGSRGMRLEQVVAALRERWPQA